MPFENRQIEKRNFTEVRVFVRYMRMCLTCPKTMETSASADCTFCIRRRMHHSTGSSREQCLFFAGSVVRQQHSNNGMTAGQIKNGLSEMK